MESNTFLEPHLTVIIVAAAISIILVFINKKREKEGEKETTLLKTIRIVCALIVIFEGILMLMKGLSMM